MRVLLRVVIQLDELEEDKEDELEEDILPELLLQVRSCMADDRLFHFEEGPENKFNKSKVEKNWVDAT